MISRKDVAIPVDENGRCVVSVPSSDDKDSNDRPVTWECSDECKLPTKEQIKAIFDVVKTFKNKSVEKIRNSLHTCDEGCSNEHYTKVVGDYDVVYEGHPFLCCNGKSCLSILRLLRAIAPHYSKLRKFLRKYYDIKKHHHTIHNIDVAL